MARDRQYAESSTLKTVPSIHSAFFFVVQSLCVRFDGLLALRSSDKNTEPLNQSRAGSFLSV